MKSSISRMSPRKKVYRSYKDFNLAHFNIVLNGKLLNCQRTTNLKRLFAVWTNTRIKVKMLRYNAKSFMMKNLRKAIIHGSKFKNRFDKCRTHENWCNYKIQRNYYCVRLLRKTKKWILWKFEIKGTLMQIWKSANIFVFTWK